MTLPAKDIELVLNAYDCFMIVGKFPYNLNSRRMFFKFCDLQILKYFAELHDDSILLTEEARKRLTWIQGPHAKALLRAWLIANDGNHYGSSVGNKNKKSDNKMEKDR